MAEYIWEAQTSTGEIRKGVMVASSPEEVMNKLRSQQLQPIKVKKKPKEISLDFLTGFSLKDLVIFTRQLATMIDAGLPLVQALEILGSQSEKGGVRKVILSVKQEVEGGATFSDALKKHPRVFDELYVNLVKAGEVGGILDTILNRLATTLEKRAKLKRQLLGAMVYPAIILCVAIGAVAIMLGFVIPQFQAMFASMGASGELPAPTQFVINLSQGFKNNLPYIAAAIIALVIAFSAIYRTKNGKRAIHRFLLMMPIIGPVIRKIAVARFVRTLGTLLSSGVPILDALDIVARSAGNVVVEEGIRYAREKVSEGKTLSDPLMETRVFPGMVVQMLSVGEQTGALDQMCNKIADFYEEEVDAAVSALTSMLEPIMMVFLGGIVGGLLIAMYLPIFEIAGKVKTE